MHNDSHYMLEVIGPSGFRIGPMQSVDPTLINTSFADHAKFVLENHPCPRVSQAIMYNSHGKVVAAENMHEYT